MHDAHVFPYMFLKPALYFFGFLNYKSIIDISSVRRLRIYQQILQDLGTLPIAQVN